jgi:hypothetical protein
MRFLTLAFLSGSAASGSHASVNVASTNRLEALAAALDEWLEKSIKIDKRSHSGYIPKIHACAKYEDEFDVVLKRLIADYRRTAKMQADAPVMWLNFFEGVPQGEERARELGNVLRFLKRTAFTGHMVAPLIGGMSVSLASGWVMEGTEAWSVHQATDHCRYTFFPQDNEKEKGFMRRLAMMKHFSYDFDAVCLGDETGMEERLVGSLQVDRGATKVRLVKSGSGQRKLIIKCYYKNPVFISPFRGFKIGEYSVFWRPEPERPDYMEEALGLVRDLPPDFRPNADQVVAQDSYGGGRTFAYSQAKAGQLCVNFEAAKRAYMKHVIAVNWDDTIPDFKTSAYPVIDAFVNSIPNT